MGRKDRGANGVADLKEAELARRLARAERRCCHQRAGDREAGRSVVVVVVVALLLRRVPWVELVEGEGEGEGVEEGGSGSMAPGCAHMANSGGIMCAHRLRCRSFLFTTTRPLGPSADRGRGNERSTLKEGLVGETGLCAVYWLRLLTTTGPSGLPAR